MVDLELGEHFYALFASTRARAHFKQFVFFLNIYYSYPFLIFLFSLCVAFAHRLAYTTTTTTASPPTPLHPFYTLPILLYKRRGPFSRGV